MSPVDSYIRRQALLAAAFNLVLNPLLAWLGNREMEFRSLWAADGIAVDLAVTAIILSLLVALFMARDLKVQLDPRQPTLTGEPPPAPGWLLRLPSRASSLGLLLGAAVALIVVLVSWLLDLAGVSGLSAAAYLLFKAIFCGALGYAVARWVIIRQLAATPEEAR